MSILKNKNPKGHLFTVAVSYFVSRALHVAAELGIADYLKEGEKSCADLAHVLKLDEGALYSLMRVLAAENIFQETSHKVFVQTLASEFLTSDHPESLRSFIVIHCGEPIRWQATQEMAHTVKTGASAFNHMFGTGYFDYLAKRSSTNDDFNESMAALSVKEDKELAVGIDFSGNKKVVDIGGGNGGLLRSVLTQNHHLYGVLFELPAVLDALDKSMFDGVKDRVNYQVGSFFESISVAADCYLLKRVLHDWNDEQCVAILKNCAQAMPNGAVLLVMEGIVPNQPGPHMLKTSDLFMRVMFGGQERTREEYEQLFAQAGLVLDCIDGEFSGMSVMRVLKKL